MAIRHIFLKLHWLIAIQFGLDPRRFLRAMRGIPAFMRDWLRFRRVYVGKLTLKPCLHDRYEEGGTTKSEYFWQDLLVASWIHDARPEKHVDVGSQVDGFVAHVASFREIEVFDIRPITTRIPNVVFKQADLMKKGMNTFASSEGYCDSLSCLHAIEHFGLGRYGDPIDPQGYKHGIANLAALLKPSGKLYLAAPIGIERVEFNANRVFDPRTIIHCAEINGLQLQDFMVIEPGGRVRPLDPTADVLREFAQLPYNLGIFVFVKGRH